jgi:hypothetical protein
MTTADRIRAMSDEELAVMLADEIPHGDCYGCRLECAVLDGDKFNDGCKNAFYKWLQQPAKVASKKREIAKVCFNCKHHKLVDGSFDGGVVKCMLKGTYHYLEAPGCKEFIPRFDDEDA